MPPPDAQDTAMRKEVLATLEVNPAAPFETILGNWHYRHHGMVDAAAESRLRAILEEERALAAARPRVTARPWWHMW
jgi:hypothetical protein